MEGYQNKHFGLAGQTVRVKEKSTVGSPYPWQGCEVPVLITAEYPAYLLGTVMPHRNPMIHPISVEVIARISVFAIPVR